MEFRIQSSWVFLAAIFLLISCKTSNIGKAFPTKYLLDLEGSPINAEQIKGKKVIIDYWFIGCKPCLAEMKNFPDLLQKDKDLKIISISVDAYAIWTKVLVSEKDSLETKDVKEYIEMSGVQSIVKNDISSWIHYNYEDGRSRGWPVIQDLDINAYPTYLLLDENAKIIKQSNKIKDCLGL